MQQDRRRQDLRIAAFHCHDGLHIAPDSIQMRQIVGSIIVSWRKDMRQQCFGQLSMPAKAIDEPVHERFSMRSDMPVKSKVVT